MAKNLFRPYMDPTAVRSAQSMASFLKHFCQILIVLSRDEKHLAIFRIIEDASIVDYRGPILKVISMLMQLFSLYNLNKEEDRKVASLLLKGDTAQLIETERLFLILSTIKGKSTGNYLSIAIHRLLKSLLCPPSLPDENLACPTEVFLFLVSLSEEGFHPAALVKGLCCKMQFNMRIVYLHVVRMKAAYHLVGQDYKPFEEDTEPPKGMIDPFFSNYLTSTKHGFPDHPGE